MMHIDFINVFYGRDNATNFTAQLFRLIAKADAQNKGRLRLGFPVEVSLYEWWTACQTLPSIDEVHAQVDQLIKAKSL